MPKAFGNISTVYFVGIGGIGMSAIARHFLKANMHVEGYDKTPTPLTQQLEKEGAQITFIDAIEEISRAVGNADKNEVLVVYTPAIPAASQLLNWFVNNGYQVKKRSEVLAELTKNHFTIAVAGTHGKTTTCCYLAHFFKQANLNFTAFLGGISANYGSNYITNGDSEEQVLIVEADEFDRSFHRLHPNISIITSIEPDHLDIYGNYESLQEAYQVFANQTQQGGKIIVNDRFSNKILVGKECTMHTYGLYSEQFGIQQIGVANHQFFFELGGTGSLRFVNGLPGEHNALNATAAMAAASEFMSYSDLSQYLPTFTGVQRRFQRIFESESSVYIDDYAHHPTELKYAIETATKLYPERKTTVVFQPHLFSRTQDLANEFAEVLAMANELIIMPIYPARELPIKGVTSNWLLSKAGKGKVLNHEQVLDYVSTEKPELLLTLGAGNIDLLVPKIQSIYQKAVAV
ncbi:MAG: UDP-N-acetylmuramate--L-alanine ligase [Bacteroidetes bacterium]|nr:UDP-N-acetylmuramate--L-alanine ligase [Bacteroidota bacterium]